MQRRHVPETAIDIQSILEHFQKDLILMFKLGYPARSGFWNRVAHLAFQQLRIVAPILYYSKAATPLI